MKRSISLCVGLLLVFSLCACSLIPTHTAEEDGKRFEINIKDNTVFDGEYEYHYTVSGDSENYKIDINFPDGSACYYQNNGSYAYSGGSFDDGQSPYASTNTLISIIKRYDKPSPKPIPLMKWVIIILTIALGAFCAAAPEAAWEIGHMWQLEYGKPTEDAIKLTRVGGILAIIGGVAMIIIR